MALAAIAACAVLLGGWVLLEYGQWSALYQRMAMAAEKRELRDINRQIELENRRLLERVALLERSAQVDQQAYSEVRQSIEGLQTEILQLREELQFYRGILAASKDERGLKVQGLRLEDLGGDGRYRFKLVLTHLVQDDRVVEGDVSVVLEGREGASEKRLNLRDIQESEAADLSFSFKHFQRFEGTFVLPPGFMPSRVRVQVSEKNKGAALVERAFDWAQLMG